MLSPISAHTLYLHTCPNVSSSTTFYYYWDYYTIKIGGDAPAALHILYRDKLAAKGVRNRYRIIQFQSILEVFRSLQNLVLII